MKQKLVFNPYLPSWEYIPDGEPHLFGDRVYLFGSHDCFGADDYCPNDYVCWSAPAENLADWRYEGVIYRKEQDPRSKGKLPLYAPDVAQGPDGRYYLYYSAQNTGVLSVAVCDTPAGAYEYYGDVHRPDGRVWGTSFADWFEFDPAVLSDDDGRIWLYSGSAQPYNKRFGHPVVGAFVRELAPDMLTTISEPKIIMPVGNVPGLRQLPQKAAEKTAILRPAFFEGSSIRKFNGQYYFIYAAMNTTGLNYCVSDRPDEGFAYRGCLHNTSDIGLCGHSVVNAAYPIGNYHGSVVQIGRTYYVFDHRQTNSCFYCRQSVAQRLTMDENGDFAQAESTSCGLFGDALPAKGIYPAYIACSLMGRRVLGIHNPLKGPYITQDGPDHSPEDAGPAPEAFITNITGGSKIGFKYFDFDGTSRTVQLKIRGKARGKIRILDGEKGKCIAEMRFSLDTAEWKVIKKAMRPQNGKKALYITFTGSGSLELKAFALI